METAASLRPAATGRRKRVAEPHLLPTIRFFLGKGALVPAALTAVLVEEGSSAEEAPVDEIASGHVTAGRGAP